MQELRKYRLVNYWIDTKLTGRSKTGQWPILVND